MFPRLTAVDRARLADPIRLRAPETPLSHHVARGPPLYRTRSMPARTLRRDSPASQDHDCADLASTLPWISAAHGPLAVAWPCALVERTFLMPPILLSPLNSGCDRRAVTVPVSVFVRSPRYPRHVS